MGLPLVNHEKETHFHPASAPFSNSKAKTGKPLLTAAFLFLLASVLAGFSFIRCSRQDLSESQESLYAICSLDGDNIYTVDEKNRATECLVIAGSDIVDSGSLGGVKNLISSRGLGVKHSIRYLPPKSIVVPSFTDSHVHSLEYGFHQMLPLEDGDSIPGVVKLVKQFVLANPEVYNNKSKDISGWGFDKTRWPEEKWPTYEAFETDPITRGRPIRLTSKDGHAQWASRTVIETFGPFPDEVEGGVIIRDENGEPTGIFLDKAQDLILAEFSEEEMEQRFTIAFEDALKNGITAMHDAGFAPSTLEFYERRIKKGKLPIRIYAMHSFSDSVPYWGNTTKKLDNNRLSMRSVKLICDGSMRAGGAYLYEPYSDDPTNTGFMRLSADLLNESIPKFLRDGWQVNAHAIGDRANGIVLDAFEKAADEGIDIRALRPRIEHAQIMTEEDLERIGRLGVIASIQPTHVTDDMWYGEQRLGSVRVRGLYAYREMISGGARITLGSDIPVENINPLEGFYAAITRTDKDGKSPHGPGGWFPDQKLTRTEALRGMTIDPAYASFSEDILGSLEPGKKADYVVLSKDIMTIEPQEILDVKVLATILDGKVVYGQL
ncbi:hypothetical protein D9758_003581 [Tetrapyrgos nigripes]|uniref:Amidohydrolase 3 domain-containing protein n=1 Tax=Tetrapyrgos nigripes TaxID=182062 RepID=A0A8H5LWB5_9AGAR|nr:hypothetical protein D9758_003581 [Tetrapyrgos nigripes]